MVPDIQTWLEKWVQNKKKRSPKAVVGIGLTGFVLASIIRALLWYYGGRVLLVALLGLPHHILRVLGRKGFFVREDRYSEWQLNLNRSAFGKKSN